MTDRLTDEHSGHLSENDLAAVEERIEARWRLMQNDYAWGKDMDQQLDIPAVPILSAAGRLVAEVREHRARWNDVRVVHSGDTVPLTTYHEALHRIREALDTDQ